jgi:hypothetical protein
MTCIGRISKVQGIRHVEDSRNRYYLEYRCTNSVLHGTLLCSRCTDRTTDKIQSSGKFDHGLVTGPIPDHSHIYGGPWYHQKYKDIVLSEDAMQEAEAHQAAARVGLSLQDEVKEEPVNEVIIPKRGRATIIRPTASVVPSVVPTKKTKKPLPPPAIIVPQRAATIVATHIERDIEEYYVDDYDIEILPVVPFEYDGTSYLREPTKNKLFQRIKNNVGAYVGRYDPYTETIRTDIPDSDAEEDVDADA